MNRIRAIVTGLFSLFVIVLAFWLIWRWGVTRVYVPHDKALVVINRYGKPLPDGQIVVRQGDYGVYQGIQEEVLGPGRYFINPVFYSTEMVDLVQIPAGDPERWAWTPEGALMDPKTAPHIGQVTNKQGKTPPAGEEVVTAEYMGIQKEVLTPGTYKINPYLHEVTIQPAIVVPPGSVGVVTRLFGDRGEVTSATLTEIRDSTTGPSTQEVVQPLPPDVPTRLVTGETQRGILRDVLQPGIYYLNPRQFKVSIVPVGYDQITLEHPTNQVRFYSFDGYLVEADCTVVWGRAPADAPDIIANIGDIDLVRQNVLEPAMKAACQNEGAKYTAKALIQGATRSEFQDKLQESLEKQVASRNIHVLLALIRNVAIKDTSGQDQTDGLLATIQRANIEIERNTTNEQKTLTAEVNARLAQALKQVDVARETVASETKVKVANLLADGQKQAAEIDAQRELEVAQIELQISMLDAQRTQILGKAAADVERLKNEAEAKGAKLLIEAFGSPQAYNQYIFAKNFKPDDLRLIFAGPGTFWTDLKTFEQVGAARMLQQSQDNPPTSKP